MRKPQEDNMSHWIRFGYGLMDMKRVRNVSIEKYKDSYAVCFYYDNDSCTRYSYDTYGEAEKMIEELCKYLVKPFKNPESD